MRMKANYTTCVLIVITITGWLTPANAQSDMLKVHALLDKMHLAYRNATFLSFETQYTYSNLSDPFKALDSLAGEVQMNKTQSRLLLPGSETLINGKYCIQSIEKEKVLYITTAPPSNTMDPAGAVDSALSYLNKYPYHLTDKGKVQVLHMELPAGGRFTSLEMTIDTASGYLINLAYFLHTAGLVSVNQMKSTGKGGEYEPNGKVNIRFLNYKTGTFGPTIFETANYITKQGKDYVPSDRFQGYRIFWANSNH